MAEREAAILGDEALAREIVPGSREESAAIDRLRGIFCEIVDWCKTVDVPSYSWLERECVVEAGGEIFHCKALPYTTSVEVDGSPAIAVVERDRVRVLGSGEYLVAFVEFPVELSVVKYLALELSRIENVVAALFYDREPSTYRRSVVVGDRRYSLNSGSPPPIPVASIAREDFAKIARGASRVRVEIDARVERDSASKTLVMGINGSGEREIHVTAHHDHWFRGFSDNLAGLEVLRRLAKKYSEEWRGSNLLFISYSSEESGAPNYASWYWAWGSRYYLSLLDARGDLDRVVADVNVDTIYGYPIEIYGNPSLRKCIDSAISAVGARAAYRGFDNIDFDSFSYTLRGVPALTITTMSAAARVYHSSRDDGSGFDYQLIGSVVELAEKLIECIDRAGPKYSELASYVVERVGSRASLEARVLVSKLVSLDRAIASESSKVRLVTRNLTSVVYTPGLRLTCLADVLGELIFIYRLADELESYVGEAISALDFDEEFLNLHVSEYNLEGVRDSLYRAASTRSRIYDELLERELSRLARAERGRAEEKVL